MLWRRIETKISDWLKEGGEALLISGARQTGKALVIEKCLKDSKTDFVSISSINVMIIAVGCSNRNQADA